MENSDLKALIKTGDKAIEAAGAQRTQKQLAQLSLEERAAFVREQIVALNRIMDEARRKGAPYAINVGRALLVTKAELRHGEFGAWIERDCKLALSTAKLYMLLARRAPELKKRVSHRVGRAAVPARFSASGMALLCRKIALR